MGDGGEEVSDFHLTPNDLHGLLERLHKHRFRIEYEPDGVPGYGDAQKKYTHRVMILEDVRITANGLGNFLGDAIFQCLADWRSKFGGGG